MRGEVSERRMEKTFTELRFNSTFVPPIRVPSHLPVEQLRHIPNQVPLLGVPVLCLLFTYLTPQAPRVVCAMNLKRDKNKSWSDKTFQISSDP